MSDSTLETKENALQAPADVCMVIEALLFVSGDPLQIDDLVSALQIDRQQVEDALTQLCERYDAQNSGLCLVRFADKVQMSTRASCAPYIDRLFSPQTRQTLSQSAIETLSIIAYRQPITRAEVEQIRGVKCEYAVSSLQSKGLICEVGRRETLGRPILYGTTDEFLRRFDLQDLEQLPNKEELLPQL
jgi:segregation and condensation protein B